MKQLDANKRPV